MEVDNGMTINNNKVTENFISLLLVQGVNYILPLVTIPYLVRVLGLSGFGLYTFVLSVIQYFVFLTDYGFNLTAARKVSIFRNDTDQLAKIFNTVMAVKLCLLLISCLTVYILLLLIPKFQSDKTLYYIAMLGVLGNFLFPMWYYIGLEKTKYIAIYNLIAKTITTALIFVFVKNTRDVNIAILLQSLGVVVASLLSLVGVVKKMPVKLMFPNIATIWEELKNGWNVFVTLMASTLLNNTNIFILGLLAGNTAVGYYSVADKIVRAFINLCSPVSLAIYPRVSQLFHNSREEGVRYIRKAIKIGTIGFGLAVLALVFGADIFIRIVSGESSSHIRTLLLTMAILPLTIFWDNIYGTQVLINIGRTNEFMKAVLIPGILSVLLSFVFVPIYKENATAVMFLLSEIAVLVMMIFYVRNNGIYLIKDKYI